MEEEYFKDFDKWNGIKKKIDRKNQGVSFREKEIWWCYMGVNVGSEEDGKGHLSIRPVYVLKKINKNTFLGIPLTSVLKEDAMHVSFYFNYDFSTALISQIRLFDRKRLDRWMGIASVYLDMKIKKATVALILS